MSVYVIAKNNREFLDTPVFHAGPSGNEAAIAVFSNRESAQQYIDDAGWSDQEVGELTPLQLRWIDVLARWASSAIGSKPNGATVKPHPYPNPLPPGPPVPRPDPLPLPNPLPFPVPPPMPVPK